MAETVDAEVVRVLKDVPVRIQSASLKERRAVLGQLEEILVGPGVTEQVVRFIIRAIHSTLHRYRDSASQTLVCQVLVKLCTLHPEWALRSLPGALADTAERLRNTATSRDTCRTGLTALRWSAILVEQALTGGRHAEPADEATLVLSQANCLASVLAFGNSKTDNVAYSVLHRAWQKAGHDIVQRWLATLDAQAADAGAHLVVLYAALARHLMDTGQTDICTKRKARMLDVFIKSMISVKSRPNAALVAGTRALLGALDASDVADPLLPALHKALLRNPELILEAVGAVLAHLAVPLDKVALDLGKSLVGNLTSKEETVRTEAVAALRSLARRCSDPAAVAGLLHQIFAVYNGANGKLISGEHKMAVLVAAGEVSDNGMPRDRRAALLDSIAPHFARALESETHERTICCCLDQHARWWPALDAQLPDHVVELFIKAQTLKSTTAGARAAYAQWLSSALEHATPNSKQLATLSPVLIKSVDKALQQPLSGGSAAEGVCCARALVLLDTDSAPQLPSRHATLWTALTHPDKCVLLHDKTLAAAADDVLVQVASLSSSLLEKYRSVLGVASPVHRALVGTALSPARRVRQHALQCVRAAVAKDAQVARALVAQLGRTLDERGTETGELLGKHIADCVVAVCSASDYNIEEKQKLAIDILHSCHHPLVVTYNCKLWPKVVRHMSLEPSELISAYIDNIKNIYITEGAANETCASAVRTLAACDARESVVSGAVAAALRVLRDPDLLRVTRDHYFVMLTPSNELYDKSVVPGAEEANEMNMKRENKAYSYRDQLEEMQLRRELEEKRRREGKIKEVSLTAKQKEAIKAQTAKEAAIRERLTALEARLTSAVRLVEAVASGAPSALARHFNTLLPAVHTALQSPLAAHHLAALYLNMRHSALAGVDYALRETIPRVALRLLKPQCDLDAAWEGEELTVAAARTVRALHGATVARKPPTTLTAPAFCYAFPLLECGLPASSTAEATIWEGLQIIQQHAKLRGPDAYHPALLPRDRMFRLLIELISTTSGRVQTACTAALLASAECANGGPDCARAGRSEVECLVGGLQSPLSVVRDAALRALLILQPVLPDLMTEAECALPLVKRFWIAVHDVSDDNAELARKLWDAAVPDGPPPGLAGAVLAECEHPVVEVQRAAATALAALVAAAQSDIDAAEALRRLLDIYATRLEMVPAKMDQFGHVVEAAVDEWGARRGAALCVSALAPHLQPHAVSDAVKFFVQRGLGDRAEPVRAEMLNAAMAVVELHGKSTVGSQLPVFEEFLDKAPKSGGYDVVRQSVVLLVGSLARHLAPDDNRIKPITTRLIASLSTPSQQVQEAVGNCLPHLISSPLLADDVPAITNKLLKQLLTAEKYGDRKGAAYGLAGVVKGLGILSLKQLDIMTKLQDAIQEKKNYKYREGALFAFEIMCAKLGRLFEPYIIHMLPHLLACFGDSSQYVRAAADDTAKLIMSKLSAHGVKLVLPSLLAALNDDSWRTKTGSVELLGAMAYCAPKQLSSCLPSIVPKLIEVLGDSHTKVQTAGAEALRVIGSVIRNPEIQAIVPVLLLALQDPAHKTSACLHTLLDTQFVHFIDAPSLALIMPVVQRAFLDRSTETRKMAAQIIGNMYSLTDQKDLTPYLPSIIPGLKASLLDPVPEVRAVSARALGAMVRGMGETSFEDLLPWLMQTLTCEASSVDRSGAAQGLSEVVAGLGVDKLHQLMPDIIATAERTDIAPHVKDGYIMMFIYMPGAFTTEFTPYIGQIINPILKALADENEYVRETALRAGQRIVTLYADTAIMLLLPELENGLFDDNWRIRYSSVQLLGDLLYRISGVSGKMSTETASEDDNFGTEQSHTAILRALGAERRNRVLAGLYMGRSDVALMVRQAALHVWKVVVTNTPRTLREILPTLFGLLLGCLASTSYDKRQVAARTLGDLVRKLGERVLPEIVPILERGLQSERADQRQGVCIGLGEIVASTSRDTVLTFVDGLVPTVRRALCDPLPEVRKAAAKTFDSLHATVGGKALDDILPFMLEGLADPDPATAEATLDGLRQIMAIKSRAVLPYLVPQLTAAPANTRALSALAAVAGDSLAKHLHKILPALLASLVAAQDTPNEARELEQCRGALLPVTDEVGVRSIVDSLLEAARTPPPPRRRASAALLCAFVTHTRADLSPYVPQLLRGLLLMFAERERDVLQMAWEALQALTKTLDAERQIAHVSDVRQAVRFAASDLEGELMPGFCLPKGIAPILPLFRESILNGLPEDKENAALMLGEVIKLTSAQAIQPSVVHITGPLIRILGDRFNSNVKAAVLETLALLLSKVGVMLKQFLPQLQTTFLKALSDASRPVRLKAGAALSQLVLIHTRADPLFVEMHNGVKSADDAAVRDTMLQAMRGVITAGGDKMSEPLALSVLATLTSAALLAHADDPPRAAVGGCLGALIHCLPPPHLDAALGHHVLGADADWPLQHGRSCALLVALKETPEVVFRDQYEEKVTKALVSYMGSERVPVVSSGLLGVGYLLRYLLRAQRPLPSNVVSVFARCMNHQNNEVKQLMARVCAMLGRTEAPPELLRLLVPTLVNGTKEKNSYVKANSELALIALLKLREGDAVHQQCVALLEEGARESLSDVVSRVLRKTAAAAPGREEELDFTLLT